MAANVTNAKKAAILLYVLGEDMACEILKNLNSHEVKEVLNHLSKLDEVSENELNSIMDEFYSQATGTSGLVKPDKAYASKLMRKVEAIIKNRDPEMDLYSEFTNDDGIDLLKTTDPELAANFLKSQHPQVIALIISRLEANTAATITEKLSKKIQSDVITRMANLKEVAPEVINEIDDLLVKELRDLGGKQKNAIGGIKPVAEILNHLPKSVEGKILAAISEQNNEIAQKIKEHMFVFEDLVMLEGRDLQGVLKEIDGQKLALALKAASDELKNKIFGNVSERVKDMITDDMETMGPVKLKDVEKAQQDVVSIARKLEEEGKISFGIGADEEMVV